MSVKCLFINDLKLHPYPQYLWISQWINLWEALLIAALARTGQCLTTGVFDAEIWIKTGTD